MSNYSPKDDVKILESKIEAGLHSADHNSPLGIYSDSEMAVAFLNIFYTQQGFDVVRLPLMDCANSTNAALLLDKRWLEVMDKAQLLKNPLIIIEQTNCLPHRLLQPFYDKIRNGITLARQKNHASWDEHVDTANHIDMSSHCYVPLVVTCHDYSDNLFDSEFNSDNFLYISESNVYRVKSIKNKFIQMREEHDSLFLTPKNPDEVSINMTQQANKDIWNSVINENALEALEKDASIKMAIGHVGTHDNPAPHALQVPVPGNIDFTDIPQLALLIDEVDTSYAPMQKNTTSELPIAQHVNKPSVLSSETSKESSEDKNGSAHHKLLNMFHSFSNHFIKGAFDKFKPSFSDNKKSKP